MYQGLDDHAAPQDTVPEEIRQWIEKATPNFSGWGQDAVWKLGVTEFYSGYVAPQVAVLTSQLAQAIKENERLKDEENAANNREDDAYDRALVLQRKIDSMSCEIQSLREAKGMRFVPYTERLPVEHLDVIVRRIDRKPEYKYMVERVGVKFVDGLGNCHSYTTDPDWEWLDESCDQSLIEKQK